MLWPDDVCKLNERPPVAACTPRRPPLSCANPGRLLLPVIASMPGVLLTKWTVRLALACYVAYLAMCLSPAGRRWPRTARMVWTLGCLLFDVHVACAFHFFHHWSHSVAWHHTAERTHELLGVAYGNGIYFSYFFLLLWIVDVVWLWLPTNSQDTANDEPAGSPTALAKASATAMPPDPPQPLRTPMWRVMVHVFLLFVAINGAIVFEAGPTRIAGLAAVMALGCLAVGRRYNSLQLDETKFPRDPAHEAPADASV
jgi:hypothetical protein